MTNPCKSNCPHFTTAGCSRCDNIYIVPLPSIYQGWFYQKLVKDQTAAEPEFYSALYENRSEMYTLFNTTTKGLPDEA